MSLANILKKISACVEKTYEDELVVYGTKEVENEDGTTDLVDGVEVLRVKCRLSNIKTDDTGVEDINIHKISYKVFCSSEAKINEGDSILINKMLDGEVVSTIQGIASKPTRYDISQEILVLNIGSADGI